ncbi:hypothetical protein HAX54_047752 [Datura stramonium]|uniref:Uncharacterized protein n=1 Tax=Datura stramonium TaxID=4076 RepID=A0ABS8WMF1_DATST|nr:hypothetical protein [Datura stramonium]
MKAATIVLPLQPSCIPADLVVENRSDLVKVVAAPVVGQRTYRDARGQIYDVSVADVRQVGHVDWPGSSSANETSIPKPTNYLFYRCLYLYGEFAADRSCPVSPSFPPCLPTRGPTCISYLSEEASDRLEFLPSWDSIDQDLLLLYGV